MGKQSNALSIRRNRVVYGLLLIITLLLGLASRYFLGDIPFIKNYLGDALWALMAYFGFAFIVNKGSVKAVALMTLAFSFGIEISQLYHASWIDHLRATRLGGLVLGFSFLSSDLLCYTVGVLAGILIDLYVIPVCYRSEHI